MEHSVVSYLDVFVTLEFLLFSSMESFYCVIPQVLVVLRLTQTIK